MSINHHFNQFLQKLRKVQLPKFQPELEQVNIKNIENFIPQQSLPYVKQLIKNHPVIVEISKARNTKQGDFRPPPQGELPKITINSDLNPYSFLKYKQNVHLLCLLSHENLYLNSLVGAIYFSITTTTL